MRLKTLLTASLGGVMLFAGPSLLAQKQPPAPPPPVPVLRVEPLPKPTIVAKPALWKLADADTTIYLFGTVHLLPKEIDWYHGPVATAFEASDLLVTEIEENEMKSAMPLLMKQAYLPAGQNLRDKMGPEARVRYEQALADLNLPAKAFDRNKGWFVAMALPASVMMKRGYGAKSGVETVLARKNRERGGKAVGLESVAFQLSLFDSLDEQQQLTMLDGVVQTLPQYGPLLDKMLAAWVAGKPEELAALVETTGTEDPMLDRFMADRNSNWTVWIDKRMAEPGTVFIAVGAGHLAGMNSVQDVLKQQGVVSTRVQ